MQAKVIYGSPGTGKTYTLQKIVADYGKPTLCLSFTKAGAKELASRGVGSSSSTLHSLAYRMLGIESAQVVDSAKLAELAPLLGMEFKGVDGVEHSRNGDEMLSLISYARSTGLNLVDVAKLASFGVERFLHSAHAYYKWKESNFFLDFDDMIHQATKSSFCMIEEFNGLVIDEAQDLTTAQWLFIDKIIANTELEHVWVAGDDDQAIYTWAGAVSDGMQKFSDRYGAEDIVLEQSYRMPLVVHQVAQTLIQRVKNRKAKKCKPRDEEGEIQLITHLRSYGDFDVVLYRNHSIGRTIARHMNELKIPIIGRSVASPLKTKEAGLVMAYQRLCRGETINDKKLQELTSITKNGSLGHHVEKKSPWHQALTIQRKVEQKISLLEYHNFAQLIDIKPVRLSTIHHFKGQEADKVLLIDGMNRKTTQSMARAGARGVDDELRVSYVGVTRAKHVLGVAVSSGSMGVL